ncbi:MAG: BCD family MFS transporter [Chromatocurvus sp.]
MNNLPALGWFGIVRLGLVQTSIGAVVVLTTSTINRVMVVELALPAMIPGFLVAIHHLVQMSRPHFGHRSDIGRRRTPWIIGGIVVLALGGVGAAIGTAIAEISPGVGLTVALLSFIAIGLGVGASGTSLLTLLSQRVARERRAAAASIVWIMMIAGFAITATVAGQFLDPFSPERLVAVTGAVSLLAVCLTLAALHGIEAKAPESQAPVAATANSSSSGVNFRAALSEVWREPTARRFTLFVFVSMLAYSAQDLILEPYAGTVFGMTPGESTKMAGMQHGGLRMGLWGGAQAIAFGLGGLLGTVAIDITRQLLQEPVHAYALVFACEALVFLYAAVLGAGVRSGTSATFNDHHAAPGFGEVAMVEVLHGR